MLIAYFLLMWVGIQMGAPWGFYALLAVGAIIKLSIFFAKVAQKIKEQNDD